MSSYLVRYDEEEAVFKLPLADRLAGGALAAGFAYLIGFVLFPDYRGRKADEWGFIQDLLVFVAVFLFFSFLAGPYDVRFDFRRRRWRSKEGYSLVPWSKGGDFSEISYIGVWSLRGYALTINGSDPNWPGRRFARCSTRSEALALAERLGASLGVPVRAGTTRSFGKLN